jgi:hypothetical protein
MILLLFFGCAKPAEEVAENISEQDITPGLSECIEENASLDTHSRDSVISEGIEYVDECTSPGMVREYYCNNDKLASRVIACEGNSICSLGRCVEIPQEEEEEPKECTETDSGRDYATFGSLDYRSSEHNDTCQGNFGLIEYYCENDSMKQEVHQCEIGKRCVDGACIVTDRSCIDSDEDNQLLVGTATQFSGGQVTGTSQDYCINNYTRMEYRCIDGSVVGSEQECPADMFCDSGNCRMECFDADQGKTFNVASYVRSMDGTYSDFCISNSRVKEYYCSDDEPMAIEKDCSLFCHDGECLDSYDIECRTEDEYVRLYSNDDILDEGRDTCLAPDVAKDYVCDGKDIEFVIDHCEENEFCHYGECNRIEEEGCFDLDGFEGDGQIYYKSWAVKTTNESILRIKEDECLGDVTVKEFECDGNSFNVKFLDCPDGEVCRDGICTYTYRCTESDGGKSLEPGYATIWNGNTPVTSEHDACAGENTVSEVYCTEEGRLERTVLSCPIGMICNSEDGSCVPESE